MAARDGCAYLITWLRRMVADAGTAIWTNDELQDILDSHRLFVHREPLRWRIGRLEGGTPQYKEAFSRYRWFEETEGGTARFVIEDASGSVVGTADWTANYIAGQISFTENQHGSARYLTGYSYDLHGAAADCWRELAASKAAYYDFSQGDTKVSRAEWFQHCLEMAAQHDAQRRPIKVELFADDDPYYY